MYARANVRRLRSEFGCLGGAVADPRLATAAIDVRDGVPVVEHWHHGWSALRGPDWGPVRSSAAIARQPDDLRDRFAAQRCRGVAQHAEPVAVLHWDRHRRWFFRCGRVDRRLHTAPPARDDDYGYVYRGAPGRLPRWADCSIAARGMGLAHDLRTGRYIPVGSVAGSGALAAGIASISGSPRELSARNAALLRRLDITSAQSDAVDVARGNPIWMLFGQGYALQTVLLWIIFFCSLLNLFLFVYWMPTVLNLIGISPAQAVFAASLRDLGAIFAVLYLGVAIDRIGPERALALHYAAGAAFIAVIALFALPYSVLCVIIFLAGMTIIGSQTGVNGACGKLYPARMRTSGIGWALGIGRLGGIVAPVLGGYLLAVGLPPTRIFLVACLFALIAAAATALLVFRNTRVEST